MTALEITDHRGHGPRKFSYRCDTIVEAVPGSSILSFGGDSGMGPKLRISAPRENASLSGDAVIKGWHRHIAKNEASEFSLDGEPLQLMNLRTGLHAPEACSSTLGFGGRGFICDPRAGFAGSLNTRPYPGGWYQLQVKATGASGWSTVWSRIVFLEGSEERPPRTSIATPTTGMVVDGTVTIAVDASDDEEVSRVDVYVDGVKRASDETAPYAFSWDTTSASDGVHELSAVSADLCGNRGWSTPVEIIVRSRTGTPPSGPGARDDRTDPALRRGPTR